MGVGNYKNVAGKANLKRRGSLISKNGWSKKSRRDCLWAWFVRPCVQKMSASARACLCTERASSPLLSYPEWREGEDNPKRLAADGYIVVRGLLSAGEVEDTKVEISRIVGEWYQRFRASGDEGFEHEELVNR